MPTLLREDRTFIDDVWSKMEKKLAVTARRIQDSMPYTTVDGRYNDCQESDRAWWTNSFWTGTLWHLYRETGDETYKHYADSLETKMDQVLHGYDELHHDVGFMWLQSSVMNYELTGHERSRQRALLAASVLAARGNIAGGYIRAWNSWETDNAGWAIIDCMMNIPLLFWASEQSKDDRFKHVGVMHADKTMSHFVRDDGSVNHIVVFDEKTGEFMDNPAGQGCESGSSWSRGQAWAVYGFAQAYDWTKKTEYLATAKRIAHYVTACLAQTGYVPKCDYRQPADSSLIDSSAGAITACGLIEIAKAVPPGEKQLYLQAALAILRALDERCAIWDLSDEALLTGGTSQFHLRHTGGYEVANGALIYGDYYFVEAICKLKELAKP